MPDFSNTRSILNRRPNINFVEPDQIPEDTSVATPEKVPDLLDRRKKLETVIAQYKRLEELSDLAQKRVDTRAKDVKLCLNPTTEAHVIASLKRKFGDVTPCITYEQYKQCLQEVAALGQQAAASVTPEDLYAAASDPGRSNFGGYTSEIGGMRPELQFKSPVQPLDIDKFQKDGTKKLFKMLLPMITKLTDAKILEHRLSAPHN